MHYSYGINLLLPIPTTPKPNKPQSKETPTDQLPMQDAKLHNNNSNVNHNKKWRGRLVHSTIANPRVLQVQNILRRKTLPHIEQRRPNSPMQHSHMRQPHCNPLNIVLLLRHGCGGEDEAGTALRFADPQR